MKIGTEKMKKNILLLFMLLEVSCMLFGKETGNWKKYESLKKDDYSVNEKYWKKCCDDDEYHFWQHLVAKPQH